MTNIITDNRRSGSTARHCARSILMLLLLMIAGVGEAVGQTTIVIHSQNATSRSMGAIANDDKNPCQLANTDDNNAYQQWILEDAGYGYYYLKNKGRVDNGSDNIYLAQKDVEKNGTGEDNWSFVFVSVDELQSYDDKARFQIEYNTSKSAHLIKIASNRDNFQGKCYVGANDNQNGAGSPIYADKTISANRQTWTIDALPTTQVSTPEITFDGTNFSITCATAGATIYYTTDGSDPTATSDTYSTPIPAAGVTMIKTYAVLAGSLNSSPAELLSPQCPYLIQHVAYPVYYMIPGAVSGSNTTVNTYSLPRQDMAWKFINAGIESGVQYYYIQNNSTGDYLYGNSSSNVYMKTSSEYDASSNDYKFRIIFDGMQGARIMPKSKSGYWLIKSDNTKVDAVGVNNSIISANCRWNLISIPDNKMPAQTPPFTVSTGGHATYYKIQNGKTDGNYYIIPTGSNAYANTATGDNENMRWYFKEAGSDDWLSYYYIVNAVTGKYLYYRGEITSAGQSNAFEAKDISESNNENEDRFLFALAGTTRSVSDGEYFIVPKPIRYTDTGIYYNVIWRDGGNALLTSNIRDESQRRWSFAPTTFTCPTPQITYDETTQKVTITCAAQGVSIYFLGYDGETGSDPDLASDMELLEYRDAFSPTHAYYRAIAARNIDGSDQSNVALFGPISGFKCDKPVITYNADTKQLTMTASPGTTIYYVIDAPIQLDGLNLENLTEYNPSAQPTLASHPQAVRAIAIEGGNLTTVSDIAVFCYAPIPVSRTSEITELDLDYIIATDDFDSNVTIGTEQAPFTGSIDGGGHTINLSRPLFDYVHNATIKNVIIGSISISGGTDVGAIAGVSTGATRIYNCGVLDGSISGSHYVGSIVGMLSGTSRVINCYSYANVSGGTSAAGIVGYNRVASTAASIQTMVMNCMFYGNVSNAASISPIYGGQIINNNSDNGLNNYNYFSFEDFTSTITTFNCALGAEKRFLNRFEFYRQILNSNRKLAAWYISGSTDDDAKMYKWVLDKTVAQYPILKPFGNYPSVINIDAEHAISQAERNKGGLLGTLSVSIKESNTTDGGQTKPSGASVTTHSLTLNRTDKDPDNYNFNYDKVQLPYYNDVGTGNYTGNRVVTDWKITAITGGTSGSFTTGTDATVDGSGNITATLYNFADRNCTKKDLYSESGRVFSQGAYFDVPTGVTAITIEPYWAVATYLSDPNYDKTFSNSYGNGYNITQMGTRYTNNTNYMINGSSQKVYTTLNNAINALSRSSNSSVYDYAVVLVGNYHQYYGNSTIKNDGNGFTIMSADLDGDNEPDNCLIYQHQQRQAICPIRFDFLCWPGIGMAQKPSDSPRMPSIGIFKPKGWFEVTNTCIAQFQEFEYDNNDQNKVLSPLILMGGIFEQIVSANKNNPDRNQYMILGGNVWFKMFNNGIHTDGSNFTPHRPISVCGGDYDEFYLSGMFKPTASVDADNAECYISGGRFGELAGAGQEQIDGNVTWLIHAADITNFYGGGINAQKPITGNINIEIKNSHVDQFCGGPKFGDMTDGKTVITHADGCTFGKYFGAGYGGTSFNRDQTKNLTNAPNYGFSGWATSDYKRKFDSTKGDIATKFEYELFAYAGFADNNNVGRFYVNYASLSLATTHSVTNGLVNCTILGNFYGGGSLGKVVGDVTSTLTGCTVHGSVFGAGFSAQAPTVDVMPIQGFTVEPNYDGNSGSYRKGQFPASVTYTWKQATDVSEGNEFEEDAGQHYILTTVDMTGLGVVQGKTTVNIEGNTIVMGKNVVETKDEDDKLVITYDETKQKIGGVFGGGDASAVIGDTEVKINASGTKDESLNNYNVYNVYGGGNSAGVSMDAEVIIQGKSVVNGNVFGGGNEGIVGGSSTVNIQQ